MTAASEAGTHNTKVLQYGEHKWMDKYTDTLRERLDEAPVVSVTVGLKEDEEGEREVRKDDEIVGFGSRQLKKTW